MSWSFRFPFLLGSFLVGMGGQIRLHPRTRITITGGDEKEILEPFYHCDEDV